MNARAMKRAGGAEVIFEDTVMEEGTLLEEVEGRRLAMKIISLLDAPDRLEKMGKSSGAFMNHHAAERIASEIQGNSLANSSINHSSQKDPKPLLNDNQLLVELRGAWQEEQDEYDPQKVIGSADDLDYYRHRAASLLTSPSWPERNLGVKLIGLLKHQEKLGVLHATVSQSEVQLGKHSS